MEAIGLVASISQLIGLTFSVFNLYGELKDASSWSEDIRAELSTTAKLLEGLEYAMRGKCAVTNAEVVEEAILGYRKSLYELQRRAEPKETRGIRLLKVPFTKPKVASLIQRIERYRGVFSLVLALNQK